MTGLPKSNKSVFAGVLLIMLYLLVSIGLGYKTYTLFSTVTDYPFARGWSEGGRIFAAFQIYAPVISGQYLGLPWMDAGRSVLDGLILLLPDSKIWMYRAWVPTLFLTSALLASVVMVNKLASWIPAVDFRPRKIKMFLVLFGTLFLLQGPVYYHVLLGIIPVLVWYDAKKPYRTLGVILAASVWEGLCRVNWFFMPAIVALVLYLLTEPMSEKKFMAYFKWPLFWTAGGILTSFLTHYSYLAVANFPAVFLNSDMKYSFFKSKFWPNNGFSLGLIPGIFVLTFPLILVLMFYFINQCKKGIGFIRFILLALILLALFSGSTLVSLRAGGGYDLHNYDTFFVVLFLAFLGVILSVKKTRDFVPEKFWGEGVVNSILLISLIPLLYFVSLSRPVGFSYPAAETQKIIAEINAILQSVASDERPILFIENRQLIVFGYVRPETIFVPYEKIELMEMAMANNWEYLGQFWADVEAHKFSAIITEILFQGYQNPNDNPYWHENNVWVDGVAYPIQEFYQMTYQNIELGFEIYLPNQNP